MTWRPGDEILLREVWGAHVWTARPVRVVQDSDALIALYVAPGTRWTGPDGLRMPPSDLSGWPMEERVWGNGGTLRLTRPGARHSVLAFYEPAPGLRSWYVNIEEPLRRTRLGFDFTDLLLDMLVTPDLHWSLKDEDELARAVEIGLISPETAAAVRAEVACVIESISSGNHEFEAKWRNWRPDPGWSIPVLPIGWEVLP
jgi:hypothetical protein